MKEVILLKAAIYSRKSKFSEKGESVENQITLCEEYAKTMGITEFLIYEDEGFSGGNTERPKFQKMMRDAKLKKFSYLICYRLDRVSRNVSDFTNTIEDLKKYNVEFISIREQFDTSSPMGRAMMNIAAVFAQLERETIAERIKDNMMELSKTGRWLGGTAPLGFMSEQVKYSDENGKDKKMFKLIEVPEEMQTVKLIYNLYLEKKGFSSVATFLCKNRYKGKNGGEFSRQTVQQIITNPVYCIADENAFKYFHQLGATIYGDPNSNGFMVYNKNLGGKIEKPIDEWIFSVGQHDGIISSANWIECQNINRANKSKASPRSGTSTKFLLSNLIVCGCCGSGMASWSRIHKDTGKITKYYRCNLKNRASNRCSTKMLNAYKADEQVIENLKNINEEQLIKNYKQHLSEVTSNDNCHKEIENLRNEVESNNKIIRGLIRKLALMDDNPDTINQFKKEISLIQLENSDIEEKIKGIENESSNVMENKISVDEILEKLSNFKKYIDYVDFAKKRELILALVESIVWDSENGILEVNLIGSGKGIPRGGVYARNLLYGNKCISPLTCA